MAEPGRKLRVACFAHLSEISGAITSLLNMAIELDREKFETIFVVPGTGPIIERAIAAGVQPIILANPEVSLIAASPTEKLRVGLRRLAYVRRVASFLRRERVDVVYISSVHSIFAGLGAALARKPIVWHVHETIESPTRATRMKLRLVERLSSALFYDSRSGMDAFPASSVARKAIQLNWVDVAKYRLQDDAARVAALRSLHVSAPMVLANGVIPRKGPKTFLRAAATVLASIQPGEAKPTFVLTGTVEPALETYLQELHDMAKQLGIAKHVRFAGVREDMPALLGAATIYVSPSLNEAMPITIVEAMAAGTPVISTDVGDCREFLENGSLGIIIPPEDPYTLADAILELLRNPLRRQQLSELGQQKIAKLYPHTGFFAEVEHVLTEVASSRD